MRPLSRKVSVGLGVIVLSAFLSAEMYYIDQPVPVVLKHGEFGVAARLQTDGGMLARASVGLWDRLTLGVSYAADSIFGIGAPRFNQPPVGFQARLLGLNEGTWYPSILGGYESQGYDGYLQGRYRTLPSGAYLALAKTFWSTRTEVSLGANYLPGFGFDGHLAVREFCLPDWDFLLEYDMGLNDTMRYSALGLLNFGTAVTFNGNLTLRLALRDILNCRKQGVFRIGLNRVFDIAFQQRF